MRLHDANAILTEQVMKEERDHDAAMADSYEIESHSSDVVRASQYQD